MIDADAALSAMASAMLACVLMWVAQPGGAEICAIWRGSKEKGVANIVPAP